MVLESSMFLKTTCRQIGKELKNEFNIWTVIITKEIHHVFGPILEDFALFDPSQVTSPCHCNEIFPGNVFPNDTVRLPRFPTFKLNK